MKNTDKLIKLFSKEYKEDSEVRYVAYTNDDNTVILYKSIIVHFKDNDRTAIEDKVNILLEDTNDVFYSVYDDFICVFLEVVEKYDDTTLPLEAAEKMGYKIHKNI
jgi:hypothetical protein